MDFVQEEVLWTSLASVAAIGIGGVKPQLSSKGFISGLINPFKLVGVQSVFGTINIASWVKDSGGALREHDRAPPWSETIKNYGWGSQVQGFNGFPNRVSRLGHFQC